MAIHHLNEARARSSRTEVMSRRAALPAIGALSVVSWMATLAIFLGVQQLLGL